jgi:hypothetical protein
VCSLLALLSLPQFVLYWGLVWEPAWFRFLGRYFQPFNLGLVAAAGVALFAVERVLRDAGPLRRFAVFGLVTLGPCVALTHGMRTNHRYAREYAAMTLNYQAALDGVTARAAPGSGRPVLLTSYHAGESEMVIATTYYLHRRGYTADDLWYAPRVDESTPDWMKNIGADGVPGLFRGGLRNPPADPAAVVCFRDSTPGAHPPARVVWVWPAFRF